MTKILPLDKYHSLNMTKANYKSLISNEKYLERNTMQLYDDYTQKVYADFQKPSEIRITSDNDPRSKFKRSLAKENSIL